MSTSAILACGGDDSGVDEASSTGADDDTNDSLDTAESEGSEDPLLEPLNVTWILDWDPGSATSPDGGVTWRVTTDLGYEVVVEQGWVSSYAVALTPCAGALRPGARSVDSPSAGPERGASRAMGPRELARVEAGHPGETDPSAWVYEEVEILPLLAPLAMDSMDYPALPIEGDSYCGGHYLLAPANGDSEVLDPDLPGATVLIRGTWTAPGADAPVAFELRNELAYGKLHDSLSLEVSDAAAVPGAEVEVRVVRHFDALFDAVDFATLSEADASWQVLKNLATRLHFEIGA